MQIELTHPISMQSTVVAAFFESCKRGLGIATLDLSLTARGAK